MNTVKIDHTEQGRILWDGLAGPWEQRREWHERQCREVTAWLLRYLGAERGDVVLDLAAGTGDLGLAVARTVGDSGRIISTDLAPSMVEAARRRAGELGIHNADFRVLDAEDIPLPTDSVDAVVCRYGYMLMPDRAAALAETRRVLKPGGRLCFAVFADPVGNPFFLVPAGVLIERGLFKPDLTGPNMFTMSDPIVIAELLTAAGFETPEIERIDGAMKFATADDLWEQISRNAGPLPGALAAAGDSERAAARAAIEERAEPYRDSSGGYSLPTASLVVATR